ncbi:MAG: hypothetical protein P4L91_16255 [Burkholderiaceae bacterium]|nr:hypothetical protein [Burkholderiaceae bacterium]
MKSYRVMNFNDESRAFRLDVEMNASSYTVTPLQTGEGTVIQGFIANASTKPDFIVALEMKRIEGFSAPDLGKGRLIGLDAKIYYETDIVKTDFVDLLFVRRFRVFTETGLVYARWYRPNWRDWVIPPDPMMPWGRDFYRYLHDRLNKVGPSVPTNIGLD